MTHDPTTAAVPGAPAPAPLGYAQPPLTQPVPVLDYAIDLSIEQRVTARVMWRIIPFMIVLYILNYLDRVNIGFAKLQMSQQEAWFSEAIYGLGAAIFFVGYFVFEVPSNLIMQRVGARIWMARIMITWGLISAAMMFVHSKWSFYGLRLALGVAEAGFFPGMILYLSYWIPVRQRARATAWFMTSTALAGVIGGPLAALLLNINALGIKGWQWLFLIEGIPSVILGFVIYFVLTDYPEQARWLPDDEREWLSARMRAERSAAPHDPHSLAHAFSNGRVWLLAATYGCIMFGFYGINFWTPSVVKETMHASTAVASLTSAIVWLSAAVAMVFIGRYSDRSGERQLVLAVSAAVGAAGMTLAALGKSPVPVIAGLSLAAVGIWGTLGPFWAMPAHFLRGTAAAAGIGLINSIGNLCGGFLGNHIMGTLKVSTKSYSAGLLLNGGVLLMAAALGVVQWRLARRTGPKVAFPATANAKP